MNTEQADSVIQLPEEEQGLLNKKTSRRGFISGLIRTGIGAGAIAAGISIPKDYSGERRLLPDTLTSEELAANRIRIINSKDTELYLRNEVFDFELFRDAKEGKIDEVVITLVDNDSLAWNAFGEIDDEFVRTLGQSIARDPEKYVDENYESIREDSLSTLESTQKSYQRALSDLKLLNDGELIPTIEEEIRKLEEEGLAKITNKIGRELIENQIKAMRERIQRIEDGSERDILVDSIEKNRVTIERTQELLDNTNDRESAVNYFSNNSSTYGQIVKANNGIDFSNSDRFTQRQRNLGEKLDSMEPNWKNKVYVFISVGGRFTPKPEDSYPDPDWYEMYDNSAHFFAFLNPEAYLVDMAHTRAGAPHILRHEVSHYREGKLAPERETELRALASMTKASNRYRQEGDSGGYAFVFKNKHGITFAKDARDTDDSPKNI